jgi:hypothetical protein
MKDNRLVRTELVTREIEIDLTYHEIKKLMIEKSPTEIFVIPYSSTKPLIHITKPILESDNEISIYYESHYNNYNKNEKSLTWIEFYNVLKKYGLSNIRF